MSMRLTRGFGKCGRGKPRLGGLTIEKTAKMRVAKDVDWKKRAAETDEK